MNSMLRPMSTAEILDRTFNLYRNNFLLFAGIAVLPALIALFLNIVGITAQLTVRTPGRSITQAQVMTIGYSILVFFIASIIGGSIATGATVYAVYRSLLGKSVTIVSCYKKVLTRWFRVIAAAVLVFLVIVVACVVVFVALVFAILWPLSKITTPVPWMAGTAVIVISAATLFCWIYMSGWLSFVVPAVLLDNNHVFRSFRRSHRLSKRSRGRIFLVLFLTLILTLAFTWTLRYPEYMIFNPYSQEVPFQMWANVSQFLSTVLAGPIATIAIALFYIDQRIRKEAFDLHVMMQSLQESEKAGSSRCDCDITG